MRQTVREGTQAPMSQTVREGTQAPVRTSHFDEEEYQKEEEDLSTTWKKNDSIGEVSWARFPAKNCGSRKEAGTKKKVLQENGMIY